MASIEYGKIKIEMTQDEIWLVLCSLIHTVAGEHIIKNHWRMHGVQAWKENENRRIQLARTVALAIANERYLDSRLAEAEKEIERAHSEWSASQKTQRAT